MLLRGCSILAAGSGRKRGKLLLLVTVSLPYIAERGPPTKGVHEYHYYFVLFVGLEFFLRSFLEWFTRGVTSRRCDALHAGRGAREGQHVFVLMRDRD